MKFALSLSVLLGLAVEAGPFINTRENPLYLGADLTVDYTLALSATAPVMDASKVFRSIFIEDTAETLVSGAASCARGPGSATKETTEEELAVVIEEPSPVKTTGPLLAGVLGLGLAGVVVWRARSQNSAVGLQVDRFAAFMHRLWYVPGILDSREVWGQRTPFWARVDRFFDTIENALAVFKRKPSRDKY